MAPKGSGKGKKKSPTIQEISLKNASGLGYMAEDFGISALPQGSAAGRALNVASGGQQFSNVSPTTFGKFPIKSGVVPANTPSAQVLTPEERFSAQKFLSDPTSIVTATSWGESTASFLQKVFDTSDEKENAVESVWDGFFSGLAATYNLINQTGSYVQSAVPGGLDTFTWDQAGQISYGQAGVTANAQLVNQFEDFLGPVGKPLGQIASTITNPLSGLSNAGIAAESPYTKRDFNILDEDQRRKAFEEDIAGRWTSGITDTAFTLFADPLIIGGKVAKLARIKWVDRPVVTDADRINLVNELDITNVANPRSTRAQFVNWATSIKDDGGKAVTREEIFNHQVVRTASNRDQLANALYHSRDYETGALILRWAYGDATAGKELIKKRASLADALGSASRERLMNQYMLNPGLRKQSLSQAKSAAKDADRRLTVLEKAGQRGSTEYMLAKKIRDNANDTYYRLHSGNIDPLTAGTQEAAGLAKLVYQDILATDRALAKAIGEETGRVGGIFNSLSGTKKGFSASNRFGRFVESSRQRRATAGYQAAASRGALVESGKAIVRQDGTTAPLTRKARAYRDKEWWKADEFGQNGFTRTVRLWRWFGEENPAGFVYTKGIGALESTREIRAMLNDVPIYSGKARSVVLEKGKPPVLVGGAKRKEYLIGMYMNALGDTTAGANATQLALDLLENTIHKDISAWHQIPAKEASALLEKANAKRADVLTSVKENGFWVDENKTINTNPWLESHLQNGTYMHNWKAYEKAASKFEVTGARGFLGGAADYAGERALAFDSLFQDFWRPAVLMRLGYTQRNTLEGLFRATAASGSLLPVKYAVYNGAFSVRNALVARSSGKAGENAVKAARLRSAGTSGIPMPKKYEKWLDAQITARDADVADKFAQITNHGDELSQVSDEARLLMVDHYTNLEKWASGEIVKARAAGASKDELDSLRITVKEAQDSRRRMSSMKSPKTLSEDAAIATDRLKFSIQMLDDSMNRRAILDDELASAALFSAQGTSRRRVFDGTKNISADGVVVREAFDKDSPFTPVALSMLSSDSTMKSMLMLNMDNMNHVFKATRKQYYKPVEAGDPSYFDSVAVALKQIKSSEIGQMVVKGKTDQQIADFLYKAPNGREIMDFLMQGKSFTPDDAMEIALDVRAGWEQLAPSPAIRDYVRGSNLGDEFNGSVVESMIGAKDAAGNYLLDLKPVVGTVLQDISFKKPMDSWRTFTSWGMKWLGTIPEDTLVRAPFYGMAYEKTVTDLVKSTTAQLGTITPSELEFLVRSAHRRALKDTKDVLYTIDRRTNLGTYGESIIPFISAAQNSTTTLGRLIWNDPAIPGVIAAMWNAPDRMGMTDEEGNIVIPIWHEMIPDVIEKSVGIENMRNVKFSKSSLNVIFPESGFFGFVPRPGPIVGVLASEFMKNGVLGISVEPPEILRSAVGTETANFFWKTLKDYSFGEGQGVAPDTLSLSMLLPPAAAKIVQMVQGQDNPQFAYWYALQLRSEWLKWGAGQRDSVPDPNEVLNQTRGFQLIRWAANLLALTPPQYESDIDPLIEESRRLEQQFGSQDGARMFNEMYGSFLQVIGDYSNTKNVSGMQANTNAVRSARRYSDLIQDVAPELEKNGDLSTISMLTTNTAKDLYDDSAYGWQFANQIPGINRNFREFQSPEQALVQSQVNVGWTMYMKQMDQLDARLRQSGFTSYRSNDALRMERDSFVASMANNPIYAAWYSDFKDYGSSRTKSALTVMQKALGNKTFMEDHAENPIWSKAAQYLQHRQIVVDALAQVEGGINNPKNQEIRDYWDEIRFKLSSDTEWAAFSNRFLNGDDDPDDLGVSFGRAYDVLPDEGIQ